MKGKKPRYFVLEMNAGKLINPIHSPEKREREREKMKK
jgi:hypothetical protein